VWDARLSRSLSAVARPCSAVASLAWAACPVPRAGGARAPGLEHRVRAPQGLPGVGQGSGGALRRSGRVRAAVALSGTGSTGGRRRRPTRRPAGGLSAHGPGVGHGWGGRWQCSRRGRRVVALSGGSPPGSWWRQLVWRPPRPPCRRRRVSRAAEVHRARRAEPGGLPVDAGRNREDPTGAPPACPGGGVRRSPVRRVPVSMSCVGARRGPQGRTEPAEAGQVGTRGRGGAEQGLAADCRKPPLRSGSRQQLKPSVRLQSRLTAH